MNNKELQKTTLKSERMPANKKNINKPNDVPAEIISLLNEGDHSAFEYIYLHYSDALTHFLHTLLRSREEAEEITQEVFLSLWIKRGIFDPEKGIKRYLYQLAKFHVLNHFDKQKVKGKYEVFQSRTDTYSHAPDDIVEGNETALLIEMVIQKMPPRQREVFLLSREQNLSYEEIALKLGISKNKVRNYVSASLKELREVISVFVSVFLT